jgi:hypothetical protein
MGSAGICRNEVGPPVNPDKFGLFSYNRKRKLEDFFDPQFFEVKLSISGSVKFVGIILYYALTFRRHV